VTGGAAGMSDKKWFRDLLLPNSQVVDLTSAMTTIGLWGPRAREILATTTSDDVSNEGFKFGTCRVIDIGTQRVLASRISYVGDLGWELYVPIEQGLRLWDTLWEAGRPHGLAACGIGVYGTTGRLEKCYRAHGNELETEYNVVEAGMAAPRVKEQDFIGKAAHMRQREEAPVAVLCTLTVDDHRSKSGENRYMLGREPILKRDGERIVDRHGRGAYVTSAGAGPSVGKHILMAYLTPEEAVIGNQLLVEYMGDRYPATVAVAGATPLFDPENTRIRA
jgi:glycine cleavage system aminomethyltransferase T